MVVEFLWCRKALTTRKGCAYPSSPESRSNMALAEARREGVPTLSQTGQSDSHEGCLNDPLDVRHRLLGAPCVDGSVSGTSPVRLGAPPVAAGLTGWEEMVERGQRAADRVGVRLHPPAKISVEVGRHRKVILHLRLGDVHSDPSPDEVHVAYADADGVALAQRGLRQCAQERPITVASGGGDHVLDD